MEKQNKTKNHSNFYFVTFLQMFGFADKGFQDNVAGNGGSLCTFKIYTSSLNVLYYSLTEPASTYCLCGGCWLLNLV